MSSTVAVNKQRKIIHVDMDAFYDSLVELDDLEFNGMRLVV